MKLICYLSNGYPSIESSKKMAEEYVDAGCDMIEIDFPARDPFLESEYLANRMQVALEACDDYKKYMEGMADVKKKLPDTDFILLAYEATIIEIGYDEFIKFCKENDFKDMILVGLKDETIKDKLIADGMGVSCYIQRKMLEEEIKAAEHSNGFVYLQGKAPEEEINPDYPTLKDCVDHLRALGIKRPIYCGVGIHAPEDVRMAKDAGADGVFVGSTILKLHENIPEMKKMIGAFKKECQ